MAAKEILYPGFDQVAYDKGVESITVAVNIDMYKRCLMVTLYNMEYTFAEPQWAGFTLYKQTILFNVVCSVLASLHRSINLPMEFPTNLGIYHSGTRHRT